ncbi:MAG: hypothetical protein JWN17_2407 [Frankiales bacterium]|nr:hypothetical protein [Frankiales bacterium]
MDDVTRRWPRPTTALALVPVSTRRDRSARDAATAAALQAYLRDATGQEQRQVDLRL